MTIVKARVTLTNLRRDRTADGVRAALDAPTLNTAQILEAATWKGGREIARKLRPENGGPPIELDSDGTVF